MLAALRLDGGVVWRAVLISLLGELGDKTFYLILALAAWCPWQGLRSGAHAPAERCLIFAGASAAFNVRAVLLSSAQDFMKWGCWPDAAACIVLALLGVKAALERRRACEPDLNPFLLPKEPSCNGSSAGLHDEPTWNKSAFSAWIPSAGEASEKNPFPAESPQDASVGEPAQWNSAAFGGACHSPSEGEVQQSTYGATPPRSQPAVGMVDGRMAGVILAFPAAFAMVFIMESDDKSEAALLTASSGGADLVIGAILGFLPAALLATLAGHMLERQLDRQHTLLLVIFVFLSLSLVSLSQALLHLGALHPPAARDGTRAVRGGHG